MIEEDTKNENENENDNNNNINKEINNDDILIEDISNHPKNNESEIIKKKIINTDENNFNNSNVSKNKYIINNNINNIDKFIIPPTLKKTFLVSITLLTVGIILIILGCIQSISTTTPGGGLMFWTLGGIVLIPGGYYSFLFYKAKRTKDEFERDEILSQIPEL
jgi:membrane-bound ClpP family serine protease